MIVPRGLWALCIDTESGKSLVDLAEGSYLEIRLEQPTHDGVPVLRSPQRVLIGWVAIRNFLEQRLPTTR